MIEITKTIQTDYAHPVCEECSAKAEYAIDIKCIPTIYLCKRHMLDLANLINEKVSHN